METGVGGHIDDAVQAWVFEPSCWGRCGQGDNEASAVEALNRQMETHTSTATIRERIHGDELAFSRDLEPARSVERERTKAVLRAARRRTIEVLGSCTQQQLDWDDTDRVLPDWATWRTLRGLAWHIVDTEQRYYLARVGYGRQRGSDDLFEELDRSVDSTQSAIDELPSDLVVESGTEVWTTTKVLRRLAWHERAEVNAVEALALRSAAASQ